MVSAGWAVELRANGFEADDLKEGLKRPFDPWLENYAAGEQNIMLLRSKSFVSLKSPGEVLAQGLRLLEHINGVLLLSEIESEPILIGRIMQFREDGTEVPLLISGQANVTLKGMRSRMRGVTGLPTDDVPPTPSIMQKRLKSADQQIKISELLTFINRADNWFDIYKAMECVERLLGGLSEAKALSSDWARVRQTANVYRHAPSDTHKLPSKPASISEARMIIINVTRLVLDQAAND